MRLIRPGPDLAAVEVIKDFERWLIGRDPREVERLWQFMYNGSRFPVGIVVGAAISGIEHALWDIKGKALGAPVYELLGGKCRDKIRVYQSVGGDTPAEIGDHAKRWLKHTVSLPLRWALIRRTTNKYLSTC